jgi:hypothetical protein
MAADVHFFVDAKDSFLKFEVQIFAEIGPALGAAAAAAALPEHVEAENVAKDIAEILEDGRIESCRTASAAAQSGVPEAVI